EDGILYRNVTGVQTCALPICMSQPDLDRFTSRRSTVYSTEGIVATSQPLAAEAGVEIFHDGGNAFDAAVGTAAALNVVEPTSTEIGRASCRARGGLVGGGGRG